MVACSSNLILRTYHQIIYKEVTDFLEENTPKYFNYTYHQAKENGIRCAIAQIILGEGTYIFDCLAFETVDKGMRYFETNHGYELEPIIGKGIRECIDFDIFGDDYFNDKIIDIIYIW